MERIGTPLIFLLRHNFLMSKVKRSGYDDIIFGVIIR